VPYGGLILEDNATRHAREQASRIAGELRQQAQGSPLPEDIENKRIIALIAYMQRLGVDLFKEPPVEGDAADAANDEETPDASE
jgi:cytochrome c oxidase cbb3-type subunit I/II